MNILLEIALVGLLIAVMFGASHLLGNIRPNSLKDLAISIGACIFLIALSIVESNSGSWPMIVIVTAALSRKIILYYRAKLGPLGNHEVA